MEDRMTAKRKWREILATKWKESSYKVQGESRLRKQRETND